MPKMYKALRIIEGFATRRGIMLRTFTNTGALLLPRGFKPDHCIRLEKDSRNLLVIALTAEKFYAKRLGSTELAEVIYTGVVNELKQSGAKQL